MLACPDCRGRLSRARTRHGTVFDCPSCGGRAVDIGVLRKHASDEFMRRLSSAEYSTRVKNGRPCPYCHERMSQLGFLAGAETVNLDVCSHCHFVWFNRKAHPFLRQKAGAVAGAMPARPTALPARPSDAAPTTTSHPPVAHPPAGHPHPGAPGTTAAPGSAKDLLTVPTRPAAPGKPSAKPTGGPPRAKPAAVPPRQPGTATVARPAPAAKIAETAPRAHATIADLERAAAARAQTAPEAHAPAARSGGSSIDLEWPSDPWQYIPAILGLPVEFNVAPVVRKPYATYGLSLLMAGLFAYLSLGQNLEQSIRDWGFVPQLWDRHGGLTLLTSFLLHGGWFHLFSNLYFFVVFGDNVEDRLGSVRFVLLLLAAHVAGSLVHAAFDPRGDTPCVGASAGISGVIAYYAITFPDAKIGFFLRIIFIRISALWALLLFMGLQLFGAWAQVQGFSDVSSLAHLGGLAVGVVFGLLARL